MPFSAEDLAATALVRILPRSRYRLAGQNEARFQSFAGNTVRIAYRQQGGTPSFLLFSGPGQNPHAAAMAAASWAEANWRPNAIQRRVKPGVVVVHVAPGNHLSPAGPVPGAAVPAAVWTVDSAVGRVAIAGKAPGSPSGAEIRRAANALMRGVPAPSLGELDLAEKGVMQLRTTQMSPLLGYAVRALLLIFALRYGLAGILGLATVPMLLSGGPRGMPNLFTIQLLISAVLLLGTLFGAGLVFNFRGMGYRTPGFSSPETSVRTLAWGGYIAVMLVLAVVYDGVIPSLERQTYANSPGTSYMHVQATVDDDGSDAGVAVGGELTVDLSGWPSSEWQGIQFKSSNPSVLSLDTPATDAQPRAKFTAHQVGVSRIDGTSADGRYTYQLRVSVFAPPT